MERDRSMLNHKKTYLLLFVMFLIAMFGAGSKANAATRIDQKKIALRNELTKKKKKRNSETPPWIEDTRIENYANLPEEYQKMVQIADIYVNHCYLSMRTTVFYLKNVEHFSNDEVRYALSHIRADWKRNALYTAKSLQERHHKWKNDRIAFELVDDVYGGFTKSEAEFAMKHIDEVKTTKIEWTPDEELEEYGPDEKYKIREKEKQTNYENSLWWYNLSSSDLN